jgi:sporulation protein YlmC with PRC-barrel domain
MLVKSIAAGLAATALFVTVATAQTAMNSSGNTISEQSLRGDWRASKVVGLSVYDDNNNNIGSIDDLITDNKGNIKAAILGVGGFLGVGEHLVAVPFDQIRFVNEPVRSSSASNSSGTQSTSTTTTGSNANNTGSNSSRSNDWYPDHAVFNATKDQLKSMPEFKFSS